MNQTIERSVHDLREMDMLASGDSAIHRICTGAKLLVTIVYILTVVSFDKWNMSGLIFMVFYPVLLFAVSGIPISTCFYKLRFVLPLVCAVGIFNPILDRTPAFVLGDFMTTELPQGGFTATGVSQDGFIVTMGMISMVTLMLKGIFCLMASFMLMATTRIESLCSVLRRIHVPSMLVTLLLLTYRYAAVMAEEVSVMTQAYSLRAPGQKGIHISAWGSFLGQLLLRSMDRAEELYSSMLLRGYHGEFYYVENTRWSVRDCVYAAGWCAFIVLARCVNLTQVLGMMVVR